MSESERKRHEVLVIGAGQAGLAAGYHLAKRGIDFLILEANERVGDNWRIRYDSLRLYSPARGDALPGMAFPGPRNSFPSGHQMADYLESYAARFELPVQTSLAVDGLRPVGDDSVGYVATAGEQRFEASQVIVATGAFQKPYVPDVAGQLDPGIRQFHSNDYRNPSQLADGAVLVVGLSHSGADIAHEVAARHPTILSGRAHGQLPFSIESRRGRLAWPVIQFLALNVLTVATPVGRKLRPTVRAGGGPLLRMRRGDLLAAGVELTEARTVGAVDGKPQLADGRVLDVANVIWCTGFRPDYSWIHLPILGDDGWPAQHRGVVDAAPGLYVLSIPFLHSFASMLVAGAGRDAAYVVDRLAARVRDRQAFSGAGIVGSPDAEPNRVT